MALIDCPECKEKISSLSSACPKCGCPRTEYNKRLSTQELNKEAVKGRPTGEIIKAAEEIIKELNLKKRLFEYMKKPTNIPSLRTTNGCGNNLFGSLSLVDMGEREFKAAFYCLCFIPIIPIGVYLVEEAKPDQYKVYGEISFTKFMSILGLSRSVKFIITIILKSFFMILVLVLGFSLVSYIFEFFHKM
ncbi:MAG: hypothetical protein Q7U03_08875 [Syntrophales bacterium]|nr:hypothetical protein [Syntrophales bacterium]